MRWLAAALGFSLAAGCGSEAKQEAEPAPAPKKPKVAKAKPAPEPEPEPEPAPPPRPKTPASMDDAVAKAGEIHNDNRRTMMCGCRYAKSGRVSPASCGYRTRADEQLAKYVTWSHVVPPHDFGGDRACWTKPVCAAEDGSKFRGIECCQQSDQEFATMRTDLFNLVPLVGEVATDRSNYAFGDIEGESRLYGSCDLEIDRDDERIDPAPAVRGDIARVYLYMAETYPGTIQLSVDQRAMFQGWAVDDPPDDWEIKHARVIAQLQGIAPSWLTALPAAPPADGEVVADAAPAAEAGKEPAPAEAADPAKPSAPDAGGNDDDAKVPPKAGQAQADAAPPDRAKAKAAADAAPKDAAEPAKGESGAGADSDGQAAG